MLLHAITPLLATITATATQPVTNVRPMAEVIEIRAEMVRSDADRRDQIRFDDQEHAQVVGSLGGEGISYDSARAGRERYGAGDDAPELILVRAFDATFAIDPFVELPQAGRLLEWKSPVGIAASRQLFRPTSLETDRTLYDRRQIERTEELFWALERARRDWLRDNGYYAPRVVRAGGQSSRVVRANHTRDTIEARTRPEPAGRFRKPADVPSTKPRESVDASPALERMGQRVAEGRVTRMSVPHGTPAEIARVAEATNEQNAEGTAIASNESH